jgi:hypothetical protein
LSWQLPIDPVGTSPERLASMKAQQMNSPCTLWSE